jgi:predicted amidohydrolase
MTGRQLASLQFETTSNYQKNLDTLVSLANTTAKDSIVLAPEVSVTNFDYPNFSQAAAFTKEIDTALLEASRDKTIITTMVEEHEGKYYNVAKVYHYGNIIHTQAKHKLFVIGDERKYFTAGPKEGIKTFEIDGLKVAILICFELRFSELWQQILGADLILVPAQWGKIRAEHFTTLTKALAISNQCYVIASDAANADTTSESAIITPFGETFKNQIYEIRTKTFSSLFTACS